MHNFLLGIGTVLVYMAATVLLLEHEPARTLPLAYGVSALALVAAGHLYGRYEHRLALPTLAGRVLLAVVALTGALGALGALGAASWDKHPAEPILYSYGADGLGNRINRQYKPAPSGRQAGKAGAVKALLQHWPTV